MNDRGLSVLEQYNLKVQNTYRGRGALICETNQGLKLIKEFKGSKIKLAFQNKVLKQVRQAGYKCVDMIVENVEGELVSVDKDEVSYIVKDWYNGKECDTKNEQDILAAAGNLGRLHNLMKITPGEESGNMLCGDLEYEYEKHNRELKKVRNFIRDKRKKNEFELCFMMNFEFFADQGQEVIKQLADSNYGQLKAQSLAEGCLCHGEYNHHNVLFMKDDMAVTNFDKCGYDLFISDLYHFMRKILEKHDWEEKLGLAIIEEYNKVRTVSEDEYKNLYYRLSYPEKFWKIANHYYNNNKAWIPGKNVEKLQRLVKQDEARLKFLENMI